MLIVLFCYSCSCCVCNCWSWCLIKYCTTKEMRMFWISHLIMDGTVVVVVTDVVTKAVFYSCSCCICNCWSWCLIKYGKAKEMIKTGNITDLTLKHKVVLLMWLQLLQQFKCWFVAAADVVAVGAPIVVHVVVTILFSVL